MPVFQAVITESPSPDSLRLLLSLIPHIDKETLICWEGTLAFFLNSASRAGEEKLADEVMELIQEKCSEERGIIRSHESDDDDECEDDVEPSDKRLRVEQEENPEEVKAENI